MALLYKPSKHAIHNTEPSLTEPEHKDSCDINKMILAAKRGQHVRGSNAPQQYGLDDTTMDGVSFRIQKEELENQLADGISPEAHAMLPDDLKPKIKIRKGPAHNDDKTTKKADPSDPEKPKTDPQQQNS